MLKDILKSILQVIAIYFLVFVAFLCYNHNRVYAEPEIKQYTDMFFAEAKARGVEFDSFYGMVVRFDDSVRSPIAGSSYRCWQSVGKFIYLNKAYWAMLDDTERYELIAHELGHSVLHRGHITMKMPNLQWVSLMGPSMIPSEFVKQNEEHYYRELFSRQGDLPK